MSSSTKVLMDVEGGNNMMYLPLDKIVESSGGSAVGRSGAQRLDENSVQDVADEVIERLRRRQTIRREER
jgi:membrane protease subunit HflK